MSSSTDDEVVARVHPTVLARVLIGANKLIDYFDADTGSAKTVFQRKARKWDNDITWITSIWMRC